MDSLQFDGTAVLKCIYFCAIGIHNEYIYVQVLVILFNCDASDSSIDFNLYLLSLMLEQ